MKCGESCTHFGGTQQTVVGACRLYSIGLTGDKQFVVVVDQSCCGLSSIEGCFCPYPRRTPHSNSPVFVIEQQIDGSFQLVHVVRGDDECGFGRGGKNLIGATY